MNMVLASQITEKQFQAQVIELAQRLGWATHHTWTQIHSPAGFPDIVAARGPRLLVAELKSEKGRLTAEQRDWLARFRVTGTEAYLWKPSDWDDIVAIFTARRRPAGHYVYRLHGEGTSTRLLAEVDA